MRQFVRICVFVLRSVTNYVYVISTIMRICNSVNFIANQVTLMSN